MVCIHAEGKLGMRVKVWAIRKSVSDWICFGFSFFLFLRLVGPFRLYFFPKLSAKKGINFYLELNG